MDVLVNAEQSVAHVALNNPSIANTDIFEVLRSKAVGSQIARLR